jgi:crotonobetainyl-CoA:carnitine CoA-transferase CaiB-like acyl-CoA transferase
MTEGDYRGTATAATRPLAGVRVLDLSSVWAGPMAARLLADLGADVTKVERPKRQVGRYSTGAEWDRDFYAILNDRNKRVYRGDLQSGADRVALEGLFRDADILVENFVPGSLDRLGLGHAAMHRVNPRLIVVSMPAMGLDGPDAQATGYGSTIEQAAGIGRLYTDAAGLPHRSGINFSDPIAGLYGAIGATLALSTERDRSVIEVSQQEAALSLMLPTLAALQPFEWHPRAVEAQQDGEGWTFPGAPGNAVPVRNVAEVVGQPDAPGSRAIRWLRHPDGRDYPLVGLPWQGAFSAAVPIEAARMPEPLATEVQEHA